jgi:regulator of sirC expression with transglutaminase-like and TPR domain
MVDNLYEEFRRATECPEDKLELPRAALAIAREDYPELDIERYLARLEELANAVRRRLDEAADPYRGIAALNYVMFKEQGFQGNRADYFDPKNSFLNQVMDRKKGIPITLSILYIEVGRRIGLPLQGVGFPGHFLVKYSGQGDDEIVIDPFHGGDIRSRDSLETLLGELYGGKVGFQPSHLRAVTKKQILRRLLSNLKIIYVRENNLLKARSVLEQLVILDPTSAEDIRDRGIVHLGLECFGKALADLENYLRLAPDAADASAVREQLARLAKQARQIH